MTDENKISGLKLRIKKWVIQVVLCCKTLPSDTTTKIIISQLLRSSTSVGANYEEASESETIKDLIHKLAIAKKEAKESIYWLDLLQSIVPNSQLKTEPLIQESRELVKILASIISKQKIKLNLES